MLVQIDSTIINLAHVEQIITGADYYFLHFPNNCVKLEKPKYQYIWDYFQKNVRLHDPDKT